MCQFHANMRLPHISHIATFYAYFSRVQIPHIFRINWHFRQQYLVNIICVPITYLCLQSLTLLVGRQEGQLACKTEWWGAGVVICLERGADLHIAQLMPLPLPLTVSVKSRLVLPFWHWLTRIVPDNGPLNGCVCMCVCTGTSIMKLV